MIIIIIIILIVRRALAAKTQRGVDLHQLALFLFLKSDKLKRAAHVLSRSGQSGWRRQHVLATLLGPLSHSLDDPLLSHLQEPRTMRVLFAESVHLRLHLTPLKRVPFLDHALDVLLPQLLLPGLVLLAHALHLPELLHLELDAAARQLLHLDDGVEVLGLVRLLQLQSAAVLVLELLLLSLDELPVVAQRQQLALHRLKLLLVLLAKPRGHLLLLGIALQTQPLDVLAHVRELAVKGHDLLGHSAGDMARREFILLLLLIPSPGFGRVHTLGDGPGKLLPVQAAPPRRRSKRVCRRRHRAVRQRVVVRGVTTTVR
eukprot:PhM_4_TR8278/c0_g1_i1/m.53477